MHEGINEISCSESWWIKAITKHNPQLSSPDLMIVSANNTEYMNSLAEDAPACFSGAEMQILFQFNIFEGKEVSPPSSCSFLANKAPRMSSGPLLRGNHTPLCNYLFLTPDRKGWKNMLEPTEPQKPPFLLIQCHKSTFCHNKKIFKWDQIKKIKPSSLKRK